MIIRAEDLGYWYLRLNGFLTIPNFIVHPDQGRNQETDVDLLAVRFPYRAELRNMKDDEVFSRIREKAYIALAEVKTGVCTLNGPWTNHAKQNMQKVLRALGAFPAAEIELVAAALYKQGWHRSQLYYVSIVCLGQTKNDDISTKYPKVPQVIWSDVLSFIYNRFHDYRNQKISHGQWDQSGQDLWDCFEKSKGAEEFERNVIVEG